MPLLRGGSKEIIAENARTLRGEGYPEAQSWAIAYDKAGKGRTKGAKKSKKKAKK